MKSLNGKAEKLVLGTVLFNRVINYKEDVYWETVKFMVAGNLFFNILILCLKVKLIEITISFLRWQFF